MTCNRHLFCPICGQHVMVQGASEYPEVYRLPDHQPLGNACPGVGVANLCQGVVVTVTLDLDTCPKCGKRMGKHPAKLCRRCYVEATK